MAKNVILLAAGEVKVGERVLPKIEEKGSFGAAIVRMLEELALPPSNVSIMAEEKEHKFSSDTGGNLKDQIDAIVEPLGGTLSDYPLHFA